MGTFPVESHLSVTDVQLPPPSPPQDPTQKFYILQHPTTYMDPKIQQRIMLSIFQSYRDNLIQTMKKNREDFAYFNGIKFTKEELEEDAKEEISTKSNQETTDC